MSTNPANPAVIEPIRKRFSPYRFDGRGVPTDALRNCFEAATWAASSFNDQPWSWVIAVRENAAEFETAIDCLMEANRPWARKAGVIAFTVMRTSFAYNGKPNRVAFHDLGQASAHLALQATAHGLQVHQMGGVNLAKIKSIYEIPEGFEPQTAIAIGYPDASPPQTDSERQMQEREQGARQRSSLGEVVFSGAFSRSASVLAEES